MPDPGDIRQRVAFGTSGHRGTPLDGSFTAAHIAAITQAICEYRRQNGIDGPLYIGKDTHALSTPAKQTALEVLAANGVQTIVQQHYLFHADAAGTFGRFGQHIGNSVVRADARFAQMPRAPILRRIR